VVEKLLLDRKIKIFFLPNKRFWGLENKDIPYFNPQDRLDAIDSLIKYYKTPYTKEEIHKTVSTSIKLILKTPEA
jgi:hypothetical protein